MKNLKEYIFEATQSIDIKSDIIKMRIPQSKISELAKLLTNEGFDASDKKLRISLNANKLLSFVCKCNILDPDKVSSFGDMNYSYHIKSQSYYVSSDEKEKFVRIINARTYVKQKEINIPDCGYCTKSEDKALNCYYIQHYSEGYSLNVIGDPEQVALAIIIDLSARTAKMEMEKK